MKRWLRLKGFPVPDTQKRSCSVGLRWRVGSLGNTAASEKRGKKSECKTIRQVGRGAPVAGLVSALLVGETGADEHVLVDASAQAVDVRPHFASRLHQWQDELQGLGPVPRLVPPGGFSVSVQLHAYHWRSDQLELAVNVRTGAENLIPVQCKYIVKLYILMFGHQTHWEVV